MIINENNYDILDRVSKITMTDYDIRWFNAENIEGYIECNSMFNMIEDLLCELEHKEEESENYKQYVADNYRQLTDEEIYG